MTATPPEVQVTPARRSLWQRASVVWLVPLMALLIALGVAWQTYSSRGPLIEIAFPEAQGIHARETELRYRDVTVGLVEEVGFSEDLATVVASVRLDKTIAAYVDDDAVFWVVTPRVTAQGVTGLDTVLSGVFIEGEWDTTPEGLVPSHEGQAEPPLLRPGERGMTFRLRGLPGASLSEGTPILYKGLTVGRVGKPVLAVGGTGAEAPAVIQAPYDRLITSATRFWDTSGFSFTLGAGGVELDFTSVASLISGGVAFETLASGGIPVRGSALFDVFPGEAEARASLFSDTSTPGVNLTIIFDDNVSGLTVGAPVELGGVVIGEVVSMAGILDPLRFRDQRVRLMVTVEIRPSQLGLGDGTGEREVLDFLDARVTEGLRARLATASILTGGLKIELVERPTAQADQLDFSGDPFPILPSTAANIADAAATAQGVLQRINNLPIEELLQSAIGFLDSATALTADPALTAVPAEVTALLGDVRGLVGAPQVQALPEELGALMAELRGATADMRGLVAGLQDAQAVERLLAAVDAAGAAATSVSTSVAEVPALITTLTGVAEEARNLPLADLITQVGGVVTAAEDLLRNEGTQGLPAQLGAALDELSLALTELREGGTVDNLNATLGSARDAAAAVAAASESLPQISRRLESVLAQATETLAGLDASSDLNRAARGALSEVERAARAIESLAKALERRPNSIILGR